MADQQYPPPPSPGRPPAPPADDEVWPAHAWFHSWFVILLLLVMCTPTGLVLLWTSPYSRSWKVAVTIGTAVVVALALAIPSTNTLHRYG